MDEPRKEDVEINDAIIKPKAPKMQKHLDRDLRGLATNKHGGTQLTTFKGFRGQTYGAASGCRKYTPEELEKFASERGLSVATTTMRASR